MDYLKRAREIQLEVVAMRRWLHQHPELDFALDDTVAFVREKLTEMGYEPKECGDHGITVSAGGKLPGKCILIRADMDALPMKEESGLPFASTKENAAHTCGHDAHTAMLLGAARLLKEMEDEIPGTVKLMFQPSEEYGQGAKSMLAAGILEDPHVDAGFGIHIFAQVPAGTVAYAKGPMFASCDTYVVNVIGKSGHGSQPDMAIDPLMAAAHIMINAQQINAREIDPAAFAVITAGKLAGGTIFNVIPDTANLTGTIRSYDPAVRDFMVKRYEEIALQTANTFRCRADFSWFASTPSVNTDPVIAEEIGGIVKELIGSENVNDSMTPYTATEDYGFVSRVLPSAFLILGASPAEGEALPQHNAKIIFNEDVFPIGVAAYVAGAVEWLKKQQ